MRVLIVEDEPTMASALSNTRHLVEELKFHVDIRNPRIGVLHVVTVIVL